MTRAQAHTAATRTNAAGYLPSIAAVARRHVLKTLRTPPVLITAVVQSVIFLLIFRYVFGGAINPGALSYVDFMAPGLLTVSALFAVTGVGTSVVEDINHGVIDRFRSLPMPRSAVLVGRVVAESVTILLALLATTAVALVIGFRPQAGITGLVMMLAVCLAVGLTFTWVFMAVGLATANVQAAQGVAFLVVPLSCISSAYVQVETMPGWLQVIAANQPVTAMIDASRHLAHGSATSAPAAHPVLLAVAWCVGILAVVVPLCTVLYSRRG